MKNILAKDFIDEAIEKYGKALQQRASDRLRIFDLELYLVEISGMIPARALVTIYAMITKGYLRYDGKITANNLTSYAVVATARSIHQDTKEAPHA